MVTEISECEQSEASYFGERNNIESENLNDANWNCSFSQRFLLREKIFKLNHMQFLSQPWNDPLSCAINDSWSQKLKLNMLVHSSFDSLNPRTTKNIELLSMAARFGKVLVWFWLQPMVAIADYVDNLINTQKFLLTNYLPLHFQDRYHPWIGTSMIFTLP